MRRYLLQSSLSLGALLAVTAGAQATHDHGTPNLEKLGTVNFETSCAPAMQANFNRAVALLHSFWFSEASKAFDLVAQADPSCAMAHWGKAMVLLGNPFIWPLTGQALKDGLTAVERAQAARAGTAREQDFIAAVETFYRDADKLDHATRATAYRQAMEQLARKYPQDDEAALFYAVALAATANPSDKTYAQQKKASEILAGVFERQPNHPGVAHYLIHAHDYPPIAEGGLPAALAYSKIAPSAPHALHMPSHIFTRRGLWQESIDSNLASKAATSNHTDQLHAMDYLMYAYLQTGQRQRAQGVRDEVLALPDINSHTFPSAYALASIPARFVLEQKRWADAARLTRHPTEAAFPWQNFPQAQSALVFARALGAARSGNPEQARGEVEQLEALRAALAAAKNDYWAHQADIQLHEARAWLARAEGRDAEALALMRKAVELEDATEKHPAMPGPLVPAHELLGDLLLELGQPALALVEYEAAQRIDPNRFNGLYGAGLAAQRAGQLDKARMYFTKLTELAAQSDEGLAEVVYARSFLNPR